MNNNSSLPIEILDIIIRSLISEISKRIENRKFIPYRQWHLAPLLHVSKLSHEVTERHVYSYISIGKSFPQATYEESLEVVRDGFEVLRKLLTTLTSNPRLALLVEELHLGVENADHPERSDITVPILRICLNLKQVDLCGFHPDELDTMTEVLKEKSLVSFCIAACPPSSPLQRKGSPFRLFELIRRWPKLRALNVDGFKELKDSSGFHFSSSTSRCSELQTIGIATPNGHDLRNIDFTSLSVMCGHVTLLSVEGCIYSQAT